MGLHAIERPRPAAIQRLQGLAPLDTAGLAALEQAVDRPRRFRARREMMGEGQEIRESLLVLSGWAARVRVLEDGRRQILSFLLPGDLIGLCSQERPLAASSIVALTDVDACTAPDPGLSPSLGHVYALSRAHEDAYLLAQITRLGRLNAQERIADLLLEVLERFELAGMATAGRYVMPLTQETLADALGLTSVHVNRTLQALRRQNDLTWKGRELVLRDPPALRRAIGRHPVRVSAA